jgi:hypothetical protein
MITDTAASFSDLLSDAMARGQYHECAEILEIAALACLPSDAAALLTEAVEYEAEALTRLAHLPFTPGSH